MTRMVNNSVAVMSCEGLIQHVTLPIKAAESVCDTKTCDDIESVVRPNCVNLALCHEFNSNMIVYILMSH